MIEEGVVKEIDQYHDNYDEGEGTERYGVYVSNMHNS